MVSNRERPVLKSDRLLRNPIESQNCQVCRNGVCSAENADGMLAKRCEKPCSRDFFELQQSFVQKPLEHVLTLTAARRYHSASQPGFDS